MSMNTSRGFTIIELLIVIAILATLTAIILVNVVSYLNAGKNSAIKGNLDNVLKTSSVYYEQNNNYGVDSSTNFCTDTSFLNFQSAIFDLGENTVCKVDSEYTMWCTCSTVKTTFAEPAGSTFCVDSSGAKQLTQTACATECTDAGVCQ